MQGRLLTRGSRLLLASVLLNTIPVGFMNVVPLVYLAEIGYDPSVIGTIYAVSAITNALGLIPMGILADRYGRKWFLVVGSVLPCASYAIFGLTLAPAWLILASGLGGIGFAGGFAYALANPAIIPLLARSTSDSNRTTLFGLSQGIFTLGLSVGAILSVVPSGLESVFAVGSGIAHSYAYFLMSAFVVTSVIPLLFFAEHREAPSALPLDVKVAHRPQGSGVRIPRLQVTSWSRMVKLSVIFALTGLAVGTVIQLLPTWYALKFGASEDAVGEWSALANAASITIILIIPWLVKRRGTLFSSAATGLAAAGLLTLMSIAGSFEGAAAIFVLRTLLEAMSWALLLSYSTGIIPEMERATATGITFTAWGIGAALGTYAGGLLLANGLLLLPFAMGVASYATASVLLPLFFRHSKLPEELPIADLSREVIRRANKYAEAA